MPTAKVSEPPKDGVLATTTAAIRTDAGKSINLLHRKKLQKDSPTLNT